MANGAFLVRFADVGFSAAWTGAGKKEECRQRGDDLLGVLPLKMQCDTTTRTVFAINPTAAAASFRLNLSVILMPISSHLRVNHLWFSSTASAVARAAMNARMFPSA